MSVPAYQLLAFATKNGTQSPPFVPAILVDVPATTTALTALDVEVTDIDFSSYITTYTISLQVCIDGFGMGSIGAYGRCINIGHTADAGVVVVPSYGMYYGNVRWFLPQHASIGGKTVDITAGGTISFQAGNLPGGTSMGVSYIAVWGVYSTVIQPGGVIL